MSIFQRAKKAKENKKGFTLVELIVVIVILAILAAIMVPSLVGYIDKAKQKQVILNANSVFKAMQTCLSEAYAKNEKVVPTSNGSVSDDVNNHWNSTMQKEVQGLSEIKAPTSAIAYPEANNGKGAYKIKSFKYEEGTETLYYVGNEWTKTPSTKPSGNCYKIW